MTARPPKPTALIPIWDAIPQELTTRPQWVLWRFVWRAGSDGKPGTWTKAPYRADGKGAAKSTDPTSWTTFAEARAAYQKGGSDGVGFVFSTDDPYFGVDLDDCRDATTGDLTPEALGWVNRFATYTEVSPSGTGVKLFCVGALPAGMSGRRNATTGVEVYEQGRYFTVTGQRLEELPDTCEGSAKVLTEFLAHHFPKKELSAWPPPPTTPLALDDEAILERAKTGKHGAVVTALWSGGHAGLPGASEADAKLAEELLWWSQGDQVRTEAIMRRSGLAREKWDTMRGAETYLSYTIKNIRGRMTSFYTPRDLVPMDTRNLEKTSAPKTPSASAKTESIADFQKTDAGNAEMLIWNHKKDIRHVSGLGWRVWNGKYWQEGGEKILEMARLTVRELLGYASDLLESAQTCDDKVERSRLVAQADALSKHALRSEAGSRLAAMVTLATSFSEIAAPLDAFTLRPWRVAFKNGTWDRGTWREHRREDYIEQLLPVCYDPEVDRSEWLAVLDRITGSDEDFALTLQFVAGYFFSGASSLRVLLWAYGEKGTGKSTFAELLQTSLGDCSMSLDWSLVSGLREAEKLGAAVRGKRLLVMPESGKKRFNSEILKSLTGSDRIPCRLLYQSKSFNVLPSWGMLVVSNDVPNLDAYDDGLKDRIWALPFVHSLADGEPLNLTGHSRLESARLDPASALVAGFVAWAVEGLNRVHAEQAIHRARVVDTHTRRFWADTDPLTEFWGQLDPDALRNGMTRSTLRSAYEAWCQQEGVKPFPTQKFCAAARSYGLVEDRDGAGVRGWRLYGGRGSLWSGWGSDTSDTSNPVFANPPHERENIGKDSPNTPRSVRSVRNDLPTTFPPLSSLAQAVCKVADRLTDAPLRGRASTANTAYLQAHTRFRAADTQAQEKGDIAQAVQAITELEELSWSPEVAAKILRLEWDSGKMFEVSGEGQVKKYRELLTQIEIAKKNARKAGQPWQDTAEGAALWEQEQSMARWWLSVRDPKKTAGAEDNTHEPT